MRDLVKTLISIAIFGVLLDYWFLPHYGDSFVKWASAGASAEYSKNYKIVELGGCLSVFAYVLISDMVEGFLGFFRKKRPVAVEA